MNKILSTFVTIILFSCIAFAQNNSFKEVSNLDKTMDDLKKLTENSKSIQSPFIQEKHLSFLTEDIISKGSFYFQSPNKLRWEYSEPFNYIIVFNDKNILIKDGDKLSSFDTESNKMFSEINNMMIGTIQGSLFTDSDRFNVKYFENSNQYLLELDPKLSEMKSMITLIKIYVDKKNISVSKIQMIESSGDYTSIKFTDRKLNQDIDVEIFKL